MFIGAKSGRLLKFYANLSCTLECALILLNTQIIIFCSSDICFLKKNVASTGNWLMTDFKKLECNV